MNGGIPAPKAKTGELPRYLSVDAAAELLGVNRKTIYAAISEHRLKAVRIGRTIRIPSEALAALADGR